MIVLRIRPAERDAHGNRSTGDDELAVPVPVVGVAPVSAADDPVRASDPSVEVLDVYCSDVDVDVTPTDLLRIDGTDYEVIGSPARWRNMMTGWEPGCVIGVSRSVG